MDPITFDARDEAIRQARIEVWQSLLEPRVGDFVHMADGTLRRFTHDAGDRLQVTCKGSSGSFYFGGSHCSYSGSLDPAVPKADLQLTANMRDGAVWFFHHGQPGAHRGVQCVIPCRVYRQLERRKG